MAESGSPFFWTGAASQVYAEARRLARLGYLDADTEPARTRPRTRYTITPRGLDAFREWARMPARYPRIQHEASLRVFAVDMLDSPEDAARSLAALLEEVDGLEELLDELAARGEQIPHRSRGIRLQLSLARALLRAHRDWVAEVRTELTDGGQ